jgi:hypothetical protein
MAKIYEGNLKKDLRKLEEAQKAQVQAKPYLSGISGRGAIALASVLVAAGLSGCTFYEDGEISHVEYNNGRDGTRGTIDDKLLVGIKDGSRNLWYAIGHRAGENIQFLERYLQPGDRIDMQAENVARCGESKENPCDVIKIIKIAKKRQ